MSGIQDVWEFINWYSVNTDITVQLLTTKMHIFAVFDSAPHMVMVMTEDLKKHFEEYLFDSKRSILICVQIDHKCTSEQCTSVWGQFPRLNEYFVVNNLINCFNLFLFAYVLKMLYNFLELVEITLSIGSLNITCRLFMFERLNIQNLKCKIILNFTCYTSLFQFANQERFLMKLLSTTSLNSLGEQCHYSQIFFNTPACELICRNSHRK